MTSKKRTKSFKYCSRRRKVGCKKAKKTCSYSKSRTPKCQPRKQSKSKSKKSKSSKKTSGKKTLNNARSAKPPPLTSKSKKCRRIKSIDKCNEKMECAIDPRKNPMCDKRPEKKKLIEMYVEYKKLKFNYPVTRKGLEDGMFVIVPSREKNGQITHVDLYLRYSKRLLHSMKPAYAKALREFWYKTGEEAQERFLKAYKKKYPTSSGPNDWGSYADAASHKIGDPLRLEFDSTSNFLNGEEDDYGIWGEMQNPTHELTPLGSKKEYKEDKADYGYDDEDDDDDDEDDADSVASDDTGYRAENKVYQTRKTSSKKQKYNNERKTSSSKSKNYSKSSSSKSKNYSVKVM